MKRQSPEEMRDILFQGSAKHNLSLIINFHNEFRAGLGARVAEIDESLKATDALQERIELQHQRVVYTEVFDEMLRWTTFFLMYAHAEEWFFHVWKTYARSCQLEPGEGSIQRFKPVLEIGLGIDLSKDSNWQFLCDAEKIRECLLHANGRVSLMKKPQDIKRIISRRKNMLEVANDRLRIAGEFLKKFKDAIDAVIAATTVGPNSIVKQ
jgi:hypothetical protein